MGFRNVSGVVAVIISGMLACAAGASTIGEESSEVLNFCLLDHRGQAHELRRMEGKAVVLFFTGNGCPVVRQNIRKVRAVKEKFGQRGVNVFLVNSSPGDDRKSIREEARQLGAYFLPVLKDDTQGVAHHLNVRRTAEVIAISTTDWKIFYRGAIDDQMVEGAQKPKPTAHYLVDALEEFLAGKPISKSSTVARGCVIHFEAAESEPSYAKDVAPILERKCVNCHSAGNIGSWSMSGHKKVKSMSSMIEEVILARRMPPWDADPYYGRFSNDAALTVAESQTLLRWIEKGAPRGDDPDPLETKREVAAEWPLGTPDIVLKLAEVQNIPATGVLDYRHLKVLANNPEEAWVGALWVRPGNRKVVHHVIARLKEGGFKDHYGQDEMYVGWAPGTTQGWLPKGTGKYLPRMAKFDIEMHYTTCGTEQTDDTEIGLYLLKEKPSTRFESVPIVSTDFEIPPGVANHEVSSMYCFRNDAVLHSLTPHMHLRGRWMKFEMLTPDGKRQTLCSVPRYDFNWQQTYALTEPIRIRAGTWILLTGGYDNSVRNPANPDPTKAIHWGEQSWDEMFLGWCNVAWTPENSFTALDSARNP
jgi:peroxiredoxin